MANFYRCCECLFPKRTLSPLLQFTSFRASYCVSGLWAAAFFSRSMRVAIGSESNDAGHGGGKAGIVRKHAIHAGARGARATSLRRPSRVEIPQPQNAFLASWSLPISRSQGSDLRINAGAPQCSGCRRAAIDGSATFMVIYTPLAYINAASVPDVSPNVSAFLVSAALFEAYARRLPVEWLHASVARL